jgi:GMP synthase-like glutamine amidotransferase
MTTKQKRQTLARKARQAEARERAALERRAIVIRGGPQSAEQAKALSVERLRAIVKNGRPAAAVGGLELALTAAMLAGMGRPR